MTFQDATLQLPTWVQLWLNVFLFSAFILPFALFIWKQTRIAAVLTLLASGIASFSIFTMYDSLGMVRLLGLPHVILWTPLTIYLFTLSRKMELPQVPVWILRIV
jgi:hypothetical protein